MNDVIGRLICACLSLLAKIRGRVSKKKMFIHTLASDLCIVNDYLRASDPILLIENGSTERGERTPAMPTSGRPD